MVRNSVVFAITSLLRILMLSLDLAGFDPALHRRPPVTPSPSATLPPSSQNVCGFNVGQPVPAPAWAKSNEWRPSPLDAPAFKRAFGNVPRVSKLFLRQELQCLREVF